MCDNSNILKKKLKRVDLPRRIKDMSKEQLAAIIKKKRECNAKALQIVELTIEPDINTEWFLEQLKFIDAGHFQDITEERALCKICGYPLCSQPLRSIPSQQYRISTKYNKVYDITERKNFCSNTCYKASKFLKDQLLTSPLWIRDKEEIPNFTLLPLDSKGSGAGEEVDLGLKGDLTTELGELNSKEKFRSVADYTQDSIKELSKRVSDIELKEKQKSQSKNNQTSDIAADSISRENSSSGTKNENKLLPENISTSNISAEKREISVDIENEELSSQDECVPQMVDSDRNMKKNSCNEVVDKTYLASASEPKGLINPDEIKKNEVIKEKQQKTLVKSKEKHKDVSDINKCPEETSSVILVEKCLFEWFTIDSMIYLFGEEKVKDMVSDKGECIKEYYKAVGKSSWDPVMQEKYEALCRKLNLMEIQEDQNDKEERELKPLPDYNILKEESIKMNLKIQAYYGGRLNYEFPDTLKINKPEESTPTCVLPLVDQHAQNALRRRIILDNLKRVLPDLLCTFGLTSRDISTDVRNLISTFTLSANNITFKPIEWNLLSLVLVKMLSIRDMKLKVLLESQQGIKYQTMLLMAFQLDGGYLERLMYWLTDLDNIMKKGE